jgi:uncharacterized protein YjiS (DUF1127 family)
MRQCGRDIPRPGRTPQFRHPLQGKIMFYDTSASHRAPRKDLLTIAFQSWQMLAGVIAARRTRASLSRLDDHMLKDIGLSRGSIESAIRNGRSRNFP